MNNNRPGNMNDYVPTPPSKKRRFEAFNERQVASPRPRGSGCPDLVPERDVISEESSVTGQVTSESMMQMFQQLKDQMKHNELKHSEEIQQIKDQLNEQNEELQQSKDPLKQKGVDQFEDLVSVKEQIQWLKDQLNEQNDELQQSRDRQQMMDQIEQKQLDSLKDQVVALNGRLDNFSSLFEETAHVSLLETAVYTFVCVPDSCSEVADMFRFGVSSVCGLVLTTFVVRDVESLKNKAWKGPGLHFCPKGKGTRRAAIVEGLYGVVAYIEAAPREDILNWNMSDRNQRAHNGKFLAVVYKTSDKVVSVKFDTTKTKVKTMVELFESAATAHSYRPQESVALKKDLEIAVCKVRAALKERNIDTFESDERDVLKFLGQKDFD